MVVGVISLHSALRMPISQSVSGNLESTSLAVASIISSRFMPPPMLADANCINSKFSQFNLAELVKYVISALGFSPKTMGELISGSSLTEFKNA